MVAPTSDPSDGVYFYAEGGVAKVRQADGQIIPIIASAAGTTQIWTGGTATTVFTNSTPAIRCGGAS
jgi:hypothetical protein